MREEVLPPLGLRKNGAKTELGPEQAAAQSSREPTLWLRERLLQSLQSSGELAGSAARGTSLGAPGTRGEKNGGKQHSLRSFPRDGRYPRSPGRRARGGPVLGDLEEEGTAQGGVAGRGGEPQGSGWSLWEERRVEKQVWRDKSAPLSWNLRGLVISWRLAPRAFGCVRVQPGPKSTRYTAVHGKRMLQEIL